MLPDPDALRLSMLSLPTPGPGSPRRVAPTQQAFSSSSPRIRTTSSQPPSRPQALLTSRVLSVYYHLVVATACSHVRPRDMKRLRQIANLAILSPVVMAVVIAAFLTWMFSHRGAGDFQGFRTAFGYAVVLYFLGVGIGVLFLVGASLHALVAVRTQARCRWAWWLILVVSVIAAMVVRPCGTVAGAVLVALLFTAKPFRIMMNGVESATPPYSEPASRFPQR